MVSGRKPNVERRRQVAGWRIQGLSLGEIARRLGVRKQSVQKMLQGLARVQSRSVACTDCGTAILSAGALPGDAATALCLGCLARHPDASFGRRLRAFRLAAGLTRKELGQQTDVRGQTVASYEEERRRPRPEMVARLLKVLGARLIAGGRLESLEEGPPPGQGETAPPPSASERKLSLAKGNGTPLDPALALLWLRLVELESCRDNGEVILRRVGADNLSAVEQDLWKKIQKEHRRAAAALRGQSWPGLFLPSSLDTLEQLQEWCHKLWEMCDLVARSGQVTFPGANTQWKAWRLLGEITRNPVFSPPPPQSIPDALDFLNRPVTLSEFQKRLLFIGGMILPRP